MTAHKNAIGELRSGTPATIIRPMPQGPGSSRKMMIGMPRRVQSPVRSPVSKVGGEPVGLPAARWPTRRQCGRAMDFLFQLDLREPQHLSRGYRMAYAFMCRGYTDELNGIQCQTWVSEKGANRIELVERPDAIVAACPPAARCWPEFELQFFEADRRPKARPIPLLRIRKAAMKRTRGDEPIVASISDKQYARANPPPEMVRLGGTPNWVQDDETPSCPRCGGPMRFVAQVGAMVEKQPFERAVESVSLPFGSEGEAYIFLCERECAPNSTYFMWQTT
jgi:hypothetical protein